LIVLQHIKKFSLSKLPHVFELVKVYLIQRKATCPSLFDVSEAPAHYMAWALEAFGEFFWLEGSGVLRACPP
jgi:hypothetical protein